MNVIIAAAGQGTRFKDFNELKPFIKVDGKYIIEYAIESLKLDNVYHILVDENLCKPYHYDILKYIQRKTGVYLNVAKVGSANGQAEHSLKFLKTSGLNLEDRLVITNCDQFTPWDSGKFKKFLDTTDYDGIVSTYDHGDFVVGQVSKYSHILLQDGCGTELQEKFAISEHALNGLFYFRSSKLFMDAAEKVLQKAEIKEKYVSYVYNELIQDGCRIGVYPMEKDEFVALGTPEEIKKYVKGKN